MCLVRSGRSREEAEGAGEGALLGRSGFAPMVTYPPEPSISRWQKWGQGLELHPSCYAAVPQTSDRP